VTIDLGHTTCGDDRVAPLEGVGDDVVVFNPHLLAHIHPQTGAGDRERRLRLFGVDGEHGFVEDHLVSHRSGHADTKQKQDDQSEDESTSRVVDDLGLATPPFPGVRLLVVFAATVFLSAFLLFQVQPIIGKYILPWFGSTPGVWATSLLFFQLMLLAGYAYAHFILGPMSWRRQAIVHISLLVLALVTLPITPAEALKPAGPDSPIGRILAILTLSVGAPYFVLSATAPLLQMWFASLVPGRSPYRLYALSNAHVDPDHPDETYVRARVGGVPDYTRFYEINPRVELWSRERFTYLEDAASRGDDVDVLMGDARIVLERQLAEGDAQRFDLLVVDAFNSDAIPIHLLTLESVETYLAHLADDGILAIHVSNRYVDLVPIVASLAAAADLSALYIEHPGRIDRQISSTDWILLTNNREFLDTRAVHEFEESMPVDGPLWTDDFSSVWEVVELRR
jgi:hypothetical protein